MMKIFWTLLVLMVSLTMSVFGNPAIQLGAGSGHQAVIDLNTSGLVWQGTGPSVHAEWMTSLRSGIRYQVDLSLASTKFKISPENYFSLTSSSTIEMLTRFLKPFPVSSNLILLAGAGFSSPVLAIRKSNLWSMTTVIEGSVDLTANGGFGFERGPWEASLMLDLPVASMVLVQDYNASGNHVLRFASFHNSFQLFGKAACLYRISERSQIGLEADYAHRSMRVTKMVDTWGYGLNLIYRVEW